MLRILTLLCVLSLSCESLGQDDYLRSIKIDLAKTDGEINRFYNFSVGAGCANEGMRADWRQQLAEVHRDAGFRYIRMHGLLTDDMAVYRIDDKGQDQFNFQYVDDLYDYILSIGMKPFVELSFMPNALASGEQTVFWWRGNVTPPHSYEKWGVLIKTLTQHFTDRYGAKEVKSWYFEVWNEPNLEGFWRGSQADYFKLYEYAANAVKSVNPNYKVGGPATAGAAWITDTIEFCVANDVPLDFVSSHSYGVGQGFLDEYGTTGTVLANEERAITNDILKNREEITRSSMPALPLHYTEWSTSYTPADPIHDSYHSAAYILQKIKQVGDAAQSMSYWTFTDIFEEAGPRYEVFHGGFGLMNMQGIKKPSYFAFQFLNDLEKVSLQNEDKQSFASKSQHGDVHVLLWDYTYTLPKKTNNQQFYNKLQKPREKGNVQLNLDGLIKGRYQLQIAQVGFRENDAYSEYVDMGSPNQLTRSQVEKLKKTATGAPHTTRIIRIDKSGRFDLELPLRENDVYSVKLIRL
ncbi:GH39 family glycosyl hydrolase [Teredinibacter turnerae]|uniref:GH39 family glycosyl hydrolase n=1 Tax=Teredinibacter turnerae TaxID=2426 RepID=UPI00035CCC36|nr:glycoside hydrolase [Teredinibacter turnerae]